MYTSKMEMASKCFRLIDEKLEKNPLTIELIKDIYKEFEHHGGRDCEIAHATEDHVYKKFIRTLAEGKINSLEEIQQLSK